MGIYILIAGIIGARLLYVLTNLSKYTLVNSLSIWKGGLSFQGSVVAGIIVAYFYAKSKKMNLWSVLDILCPSVCIGYAFTRIGCFLNGCCYGIESNFPWACKMITDDGIKLCEPVQLYSCVISFIIFYILCNNYYILNIFNNH